MKTIHLIISLIILPHLFCGCADNSSNIPNEWHEIRDSLINKEWTRVIPVNNSKEETEIHETWTFNDNGSGMYRASLICNQNVKEEETWSFRWILTIDLIINMNDSRYWELDIINDNLYVYETLQDPTKVLGQEYREYIKLCGTKKEEE